MDELLKYLTREQTLKLWGQPQTNKHYLVDKIHGDGKQLVWLQTMNSRPFNYYIRVDSNLNIEIDDYDILTGEELKSYGCFSEMLMQMICEEFDDIDRYYELDSGLYTCDQDKEEGIKPFEYEWPMFSLGAGYSWGVSKEKIN